MDFFRRSNKKASVQYSDQELIQLYKTTSDSSYAAELFRRYTHLLYGVCLKYLQEEEESKDAVMEIFEQLLSLLHRHEIDNFSAWIYSVTINHCRMKLRKAKILRKQQEDYKEFAQEFMENEDELHLYNTGEVQEPVSERLNGAIQRLSEEQRKCVYLYYYEKKSYLQIAEATGFELNEVKSYLQNGKRNLKLILERQQQNE